MSIITQGLITSGLGLAGVFATLILFYFFSKIILAVTSKTEKKSLADKQ